MTCQLFTWVLLLVFNVWLREVSTNLYQSQNSESLFGKHLIVTMTEFPLSAKILRNASGNFIKAEGVSPLMLDWFSLRYKFTYSILDVKHSSIEDIPGKRGHATYLSNGESDLIMAAIVGITERLNYMELLHPYTYSGVAFLVPMPDTSKNNMDAIIKPFKPEVWISFVLSAFSVTFMLSCLNPSLKKNGRQCRIVRRQKRQIVPKFSLSATKSASVYILGSVLNQGGYIPNKKFKIRLVIGAWCLVIFVLLNVYNGVLISYMTATRRARPIINSIEDVAYDPSIKLVLEKGWACDVLFSTAENGLYKALGDKLRAYPKSRCNVTQQCIDMVQYLPHHVYINGVMVLQSVIKDDFQKTKQCNLLIAGKVPLGNGNQAVCWGLAKRSPYLEEFNQGTLYLREVGLIPQWEKLFSPDARPCSNGAYETVQKSKSLVRLTLANMAGPFTVLCVGSAISSLVFIKEIIEFRWNKGFK